MHETSRTNINPLSGVLLLFFLLWSPGAHCGVSHNDEKAGPFFGVELLNGQDGAIGDFRAGRLP